MQTEKDTFLWKVLEEMDGWDGHLETSDCYNYIVRRDGSCPYSIEELDAWLNEEEQKTESMPAHVVESAMQNVIRPLLVATRYPKGKRLDRDVLGRVVRSAWIEWAGQQPDPKSSWLVPYEELDEADKEADRLIGERVAQYVKIVLKTELRDLERLEQEASHER